jgi:putative addiction module component (TIGR02574 family)
MSSEFAPLFKLGRAERLQLVEDLWDSIAQEDQEGLSLSVSDAKAAELHRRKRRLAQEPDSARSWEEVKRRARSEHV